jgi:protein SCO1/2
MDATPAEASVPEHRPRLDVRRSGRAVTATVAVVLIVAAAVWALRASSRARVSDQPLAAVAEAPEFSLRDQAGRDVSNADLAGKVWLADFIFTRCAGPCPMLTLRMKSLQLSLSDLGDEVKLVSFSIDPEFDSPAVLRRYADRFGADGDRWLFLTGIEKAAMHALVKDGFLQAVAETGDSERYVHSTRFVLVDRNGWIRAWYDGLEAESKPQILHDIERLLGEPGGS